MITIEQIQKLDRKVQAAVEQISALRLENTSLKAKLDQYQKRIGELEVMIDRFKQDQAQIEDGIIRALEQLDRLEDSVEAEHPDIETDRDPPQEHLDETDETESKDNELDIF